MDALALVVDNVAIGSYDGTALDSAALPLRPHTPIQTRALQCIP
jgi:hypothetical protein